MFGQWKKRLKMEKKTSQTKNNYPKRKSPHWHRYSNRLNFLLYVVFIMFGVLILRLGYLQIINGQAFQELVQMTQTNIAEQSVPRGYIVDRNHKKLVDNEGLQAISYTRGINVTGNDMARTAQKLAQFIEVETEGLTERDKKDYWMVTHADQLKERLTEKEKRLKEGEFYEAQLSHVTDEEVNGLKGEDLKAALIYKRMANAYALTPTFIKNKEVTNEEIAKITEHSKELPGVRTTMDWKRTYPQKDLLRSIIGSVTSQEEGLPSDSVDYYLSQGYARNDRVGKSYLEKIYESALRGSKMKYQMDLNQRGEVTRSEKTYGGAMGDTVQLTIDSDFQQKVENILSTYLKSSSTGKNNSIYAVVSNPNNGEVLAMAGKQRNDKGEIVDDALGTLNSSFTMGSTVKGATVGAGYHYGVLKIGQDNTFVDQPLYFTGTPRKASWWASYSTSPVRLNEIMALAKSSNVYMIRTAMAIGGLPNYESGMSLANLDPKTGEKLRNFYHQFGLGVSTGIDLPNEVEGLKGKEGTPGNDIDLAFGQYDTYTPIQLNQYVATIANGGNRYALHLLKQILRDNGKDQTPQVIYQKEPEVLNRVQLEADQFKRIQKGFWAASNDPQGLSKPEFSSFPMTIACKTGTAETGEEGIINSTFVAYAPYDHPEVALTIVIPKMSASAFGQTGEVVGHKVLEAYYQQKAHDKSSKEEKDKDDKPTATLPAQSPSRSVSHSPVSSRLQHRRR